MTDDPVNPNSARSAMNEARNAPHGASGAPGATTDEPIRVQVYSDFL